MPAVHCEDFLMGVQETLDYLYGLERFGMKLGLDNVKALLSRLDNPQDRLRFIHVAGTNGKGSVCAFLDSILRRAGYRVGLYTSPHLVRFNERIRVGGSEIPDEDVVRLTEFIRPHAQALARESKASHPTFFEFTTAMAFRYFQEEDVDVVVLEVGLGGRLDATNVVLPEVAVITRLGLEHTEHLGRSIERIAREKAGIVKEGVPIWTLEQPGVDVIEKRCGEVGAPLRLVGRDLTVSRQPDGTEGQRILFTNDHSWAYDIKLLGTYQAENAALALGAVHELRSRGWKITETAVGRGFSEARWPARLQLYGRYPFIVLDSTHTVAGAERLKESTEELFPDRRVILVVGILKDKDLGGIADRLAPICRAVIATQPKTERAYSAESVATAFREVENVSVAGSVEDAVERAIAMATPENVVLITGSLYTAGEASVYLEAWRRRRAMEVVHRLKKVYMPGDFRTAELETALGRITRETEDPFTVLVSTVLSQRTTDPTTKMVSERLFARFAGPAELASAPVAELEDLIKPSNFYRTKAKAIKEIARRIHEDHNDIVPSDMAALCQLPLVGRKTANCVRVYGYGIPSIPVDVHCHRIPNRIGIIRTRSERQTEAALQELLPERLWLEVNELFVRHGQIACLPVNPDCPSCVLEGMCEYNLSKLEASENSARPPDEARD